MKTVEIISPSTAYLPSYVAMIEEMRQHGETIWETFLPRPGEDSDTFVSRLLRARVEPEPGLVPETHYWGASGEMIVGRIALRHHLTDALKEFGGHIGYEVRPSSRRQGIATEMLRLLLQTPKAREISKLLLTCAPTNVGSNKTILANGGVLGKTEYVKSRDRDTSYYWIDLGSE